MNGSPIRRLGKAISADAGKRAPAEHCVATQGDYAPISNNS